MRPKVTTVILAMVTMVFSGCGGGSSAPVSTTPPPQQAQLTAVSISPANSSLPVGRTQQFSATGTYSDGSAKNLTSGVSWHSSDTNIGAISAAGLLSPLSPGKTTISATISGLTGSSAVTITPAAVVSLSVTCPLASIAFNTEEQCAAVAKLTDGTIQNVSDSVSWSSSQPAVATVASGLVKGIAAGSAVITASSGASSSSTSVSVTNATVVSLTVTPSNPTLPTGIVRSFEATGTFSDQSTQDITLSATWNSSNISVATVQSGAVATFTVGTATITANFEAATASTALTVAAPALVSITIGPADPQIALGTSVQLSATGTYDNGSTQNITNKCTWSSSNAGVATVGSGLVKSLAAGMASISAVNGSVTGTTTLTVTTATLTAIYVTPANPTIGVGAVKSFSATGSFSDGTTQSLTNQTTWTSSNTAVATMVGSAATGVAAGSTTISASFVPISGPVVSGSTTLTVSNATLTSLSISPVTATISVGQSQQFLVVAHYSDGTNQSPSSVAWTSSNAAVASINSGWAYGIQSGTTTITASYNSFQVTATLTVSGGTITAISISPPSATIAATTTAQFAATGTYNDGSSRDLTKYVDWTSSNYSTATISNAGGSYGLATGVAPGSVVIGALIGSVIGTADLTVTNATLTAITISPHSANISLGSTQNYTAMGSFSDGTAQNISRSVAWSSSNANVATVNTLGTAVSASTGTSTISATANGVTGTAILTVY